MTPHRFAFRAMAAENEIQVCGERGVAEIAAKRAIAEIARIEAKYSRYKDDSVVSRVNAAAGGKPVAIDDETRSLLAYADACWKQSGGLFDATSGILRRAWNFDAKRVPADAELAPLLARVGWQDVEIDERGVRLAKEGMQLDFGGFGKEYAVDRAALVLKDAGAVSAIVNLAGDLAVTGPQPGGEPWRVGIRHPRRDGLIATLEIASGGIATSGDYERFIEVDGVRHCHILDPRTGRSARGFQSVTVLGPGCLVAGSATTVAMLKGEREGLAWLDAVGLPYLAISETGKVIERFGDKIFGPSRTS
ncbi:MAG TPA: FAD:protein FMN transferase [Usitatibacter sp.]|nr:FAD:protein FMN transferase [Usitatibacter sp.]